MRQSGSGLASPMIPREILKKIRQIELRTNRLVSETLGGQYHSVFKGQGMNFEEVREYQPGDEVRAIDWNVTARMNHPFIKKFVEERELTLMLLVDLSGSGLFGSGEQSKRELVCFYKERELKKRYVPDLFVFNCLVVELKTVTELNADHEAQLYNYLRITRQPIGYLINFGHQGTLEWRRLILSEFIPGGN